MFTAASISLQTGMLADILSIMSMDFDNIDYLKFGSERQKLAYDTLVQNEVILKLQDFDPILVGTIPIGIDIEISDLDIICHYKDADNFFIAVENNFRCEKDFRIKRICDNKQNFIVSNFRFDNFEIEIFGQNIPTKNQLAYRHMIVENKLLIKHGESFRQKIIALKRQGYKTEPAFGIVLGLSGNPYEELLNYEIE